ncbi:MAG: S8 family serine peptidase [Propionibacteriaceae bacterium]|nr:S8 family serine peptidase [Propionibacteriaceae bacterium]
MQTAWSFSKGAHVTVAVVDSGVDPGNAHLGAAVLPGLDLTDKKSDGRTDIGGLGTAIAGLVAARPVHSSGLVGLAPDADILPVRVYSQTVARGQDSTGLPNPSITAKGVVWAADHHAQVILVPTAFTVEDDTLHQAVDYAAAAGSLVISPTGDAVTNQNDIEDTAPRYPAAYTEAVLGVTAVGGDGTPSRNAVHNNTVMLAAPGVNVVSSYYALGDCVFVGDQASSQFAAGYVGGVAALIAARFPNETPAEWAYRMEVTASRPLAAQRDDMVGWGVLDPTSALTFVNDGTALGPTDPLGNRSFPSPPSSPPAPAAPPPGHDLTIREVIVVVACAALAVIIWLAALLWGRPLSASWAGGKGQKWRVWLTSLTHRSTTRPPPKRGL